MREMRGVLLAATVVLSAAAAPAAVHEVTFLGTITALGDATIDMMVIDERTGAESPMSFRVTEETKFYRGDVLVAFPEALVQVGERAAVTVDVDEPGNSALVVRLAGHEHH